MRKKFRERFLDPEVLNRIEAAQNSPETKRRLSEMKKCVKNRMSDMFYIGFLGFVATVVVVNFFGNYALIPCAAIWCYCYNIFKSRNVDVDDLYVNNFLTPVLNEIFPDTVVDYHGGMDFEIMENLVYNSRKYYSNCHIIFGDDYKTEFCNMRCWHYTSDKNGRKEEHTDFRGQVLVARFNTNINGHIRIAPVYEKGFFGKKLFGPYGSKRDGEEEIQTESIEFNNAYSIFSTDDFYSRLILDANILEILNNLSRKINVAIYMNESYVAIAFQSNHFLFSTPATGWGVEKLSLAGEYEQIRTKLADFYALIDIIGEKF